MSSYLFTGWISQFHQGRLVDSCSNLIVFGADGQAAAQRFFEQCLSTPNTAEEPTPTKVEKVVGAPMVDNLLTETGSRPLEWERIAAEAQRDWETAEADESELGYWLDCNQCLDPEKPAPDIESLQRGLPEELRTGLNWSPEKERFFLISVMSPPAQMAEVWDRGGDGAEGATGEDEGSIEVVERQAAFPELAPKERAVLVRARNSVVAAWLWHRNAETDLARNAIRIDAWCGVAEYRPAAE